MNRPLNRENTSNDVDRGGLAKEVLWLMVTCGGISSESMETPARKLNWCSITCRNELNLNIIELKQVIHRSGNPHKSN